MKNLYDLLQPGDGAAEVCQPVSTLPQLLRVQQSPWRCALSPLVTTALVVLVGFALPASPLLGASNGAALPALPAFPDRLGSAVAVLPGNQRVEVEVMIAQNGQPVAVNLPKFDPALGTLVGVELIVDYHVMANIQKTKVRGNEYNLALMIGLTFDLPNQLNKKYEASGQYRKSAGPDVQANGFTDTFEAAKKSTELISENLAAFQGTGNHTLNLTADGLINFVNAESNLVSKLKAKICFNYLYQ